MTLNFFLIVNKNGSIRTTKSRPNLQWDEISVYTALTLPDALFKRPTLSAEIIVPDEAAAPNAIDAEVKQNIKEAIEQAAGMAVKLTIGTSDEREGAQ